MSWYSFQQQYDAQGRDKGDGYLPSYFADMSADELARARAMLLASALDGDAIDLSGLRYVGNAETVAALEAARDGAPAQNWSFDITRLDVLYALTGDQVYLAALSRYLDGRDAEPQVRAAYVLADHVLPREAEIFLIERIGDGRHEAALDGLLSAWIGLHQGARCDVMCFQRHLDLIRQVHNASPQRRPALLADAVAGVARGAA